MEGLSGSSSLSLFWLASNRKPWEGDLPLVGVSSKDVFDDDPPREAAFLAEDCLEQGRLEWDLLEIFSCDDFPFKGTLC